MQQIFACFFVMALSRHLRGLERTAQRRVLLASTRPSYERPHRPSHRADSP